MWPSRRRLVASLAGSALLSPVNAKTQTKEQLVKALQARGLVVIMRHGKTEPGIGDPPGFSLGQCTTQRQLSAKGRAESREFGAWLAEQDIGFDAVYSSQWCRCIDTAKAIADVGKRALKVQELTDLNSFFADSSSSAAQTAALKSRLKRLAANSAKGNELWVTHQVNITALTQYFPQMGEALVLKPIAGSSEGFLLLGALN